MWLGSTQLFGENEHENSEFERTRFASPVTHLPRADAH
jgi:hypothetical protein